MFLSCGDALFDLFSGSEHSRESNSTSVTLTGNVGGSPLNVAVGLARLGHHSRYFTKLSSDIFGQRMRDYLRQNELDTELCIDTELNTTLAIVETNQDGSANYVFYTDNTADVSINQHELPEHCPADTRVLHFGSYSTAVAPTSDSLLALARREKGRRYISYDPNLRPTIEPDIDKWREVFNGLASTANLIKASDEDIATLYGANAEDKFVADCFNHGAELVFVTRGPDGSSGFKANGEQVTIPGVRVDVVDTVGAGDTFQASMLHHLMTNDHISDTGNGAGDVALEEAVTFATKAASITCTRAGANLPYLREII